MAYVKINLGVNPDDGQGDPFRTAATKINTNIDQLVADLALLVPLTQKGQAGGVAPLGLDGKIPSAYVSGSVDEVQEFNNLAAFPNPGESGKLYIAKNAGTPADPSRAYRWSGSVYIEIEPSPGSTDAVSEGASNLYFTAARVNALTSQAGKDGKLSSLIDTAIVTPADKQILTYDAATSKWKNQTIASGLPRGYRKTHIATVLNNLTLSIAGVCRDATDATDIIFASGFTKKALVAGGFTAGTGGNGNPTAMAAGVYGVFAIKNATSGACDVMFQPGSAEPSAMPAGFTHSRRIGSFYYTVAAGINAFLQLGSNQFMFGSPTQQLNNSALASGNNTVSVPVPAGVRCWLIAKVQAVGTSTNSGAYFWLASNGLGTGSTGASISASSSDYILINGTQISKTIEVLTNTSQQITVTSSGAIAAGVTLITLGYRDFLEE